MLGQSETKRQQMRRALQHQRAGIALPDGSRLEQQRPLQSAAQTTQAGLVCISFKLNSVPLWTASYLGMLFTSQLTGYRQLTGYKPFWQILNVVQALKWSNLTNLQEARQCVHV